MQARTKMDDYDKAFAFMEKVVEGTMAEPVERRAIWDEMAAVIPGWAKKGEFDLGLFIKIF